MDFLVVYVVRPLFLSCEEVDSPLAKGTAHSSVHRFGWRSALLKRAELAVQIFIKSRIRVVLCQYAICPLFFPPAIQPLHFGPFAYDLARCGAGRAVAERFDLDD